MMFSPNTKMLLSTTAAPSPGLAEGSGSVSLQVPPASRTSVDSSSPSFHPPVTRRTYMIMIQSVFTDTQPHFVFLIRQIRPTGVPSPSNIELRQSLRLSSPAVSCHSL